MQQSSGVHIWPFNSSCRVRDARQWHASEGSAARLGGRRDKFNTLPSKANKLGAGEPPARTCGFSIDHSRFQRFGCLGTVNVLHKNLVARDDGSVAVASAPPPTLSSVVGDSGQRRVGKIGRIKSLPCFFLRTGGGLTTASFNGIEFGRYLTTKGLKGAGSWRLDLSVGTHGCGQNDCGHQDDP